MLNFDSEPQFETGPEPSETLPKSGITTVQVVIVMLLYHYMAIYLILIYDLVNTAPYQAKAMNISMGDIVWVLYYT